MKKLLLISILLFSVTGCDDGNDDDCVQNVQGCSSSMYSCPAAANCYSSKSACSSSGEC